MITYIFSIQRQDISKISLGKSKYDLERTRGLLPVIVPVSYPFPFAILTWLTTKTADEAKMQAEQKKAV